MRVQRTEGKKGRKKDRKKEGHVLEKKSSDPSAKVFNLNERWERGWGERVLWQ